ncbi:MAG: RHS repeat-associated core domain-containing protein, partial [Bacteroidota bacterium]
NMNGRLYDPLVGRMLSPDPVMQAAGSTQGLNRYSYCFNNPLKYVDPSGYTAYGNYGNPYAAMSHQFQMENYNWFNSMQANRATLTYNMSSMGAGTWEINEGGESTTLGGNESLQDGDDPTLSSVVSSVSVFFLNNAVLKSGTLYKIGKFLATKGAFMQYLAIVCGEAHVEEDSRGIGSVIKNRLNHEKALLVEGFVDKIGGEKDFDAIGGEIYNTVLSSSLQDLFSIKNGYHPRVKGALTALSSDYDFSNGAYFWNATSAKFKKNPGFNWRKYEEGVYSITTSLGGAGGTTFFKYTNPKRVWP